jgi:hypothetical protein
MSAALLFDSMTRIARHEAGERAIASIGQVTSVFPADGPQKDHAVTVKLRDSGVVLPRVPVAVGAMGFAAIPAVDDLVVALFLEGDYHAPIVVGRVYHPDQEPPKHKDGQIVLRLPSGASSPNLNCEIIGDPARIKLTLPGDVLVELAEEKVLLTVGKLKVSLSGSGGGRIEIAAGSSTFTLKQDGDVALKSAGNLKIEAAANLELVGQAKVKVTGGLVEVN